MRRNDANDRPEPKPFDWMPIRSENPPQKAPPIGHEQFVGLLSET